MRVHDAIVRGSALFRAAQAVPVGPPDAPRTVGPVAMVGHQLPVDLAPGELPVDVDVRGHPHVGLAAITYMLEGHLTHRDSLGTRQEIGPGEIGWMIAGSGVVHSERMERVRLHGGRLSLFQILLALPDGEEDAAPSFVHVPAVEAEGSTVAVRRIAGRGTSRTLGCDLFVQDVTFAGPGSFTLPDAAERALYLLHGAATVDGIEVGPGQVAVGASVVRATGPARLLAFGGDPVGPRYLWWNYLHSSVERIEAARADWRAGRVELPPGDTESFTPAPPDHGRPLLRLNG